ncbi:UNVERIFIED_CONTAM: hypothetical protein FKN15_012472 [Acipenser sinensis]
MDRNALAELLQALESRRDAEERRREERYTALIERAFIPQLLTICSLHLCDENMSMKTLEMACKSLSELIKSYKLRFTITNCVSALTDFDSYFTPYICDYPSNTSEADTVKSRNADSASSASHSASQGTPGSGNTISGNAGNGNANSGKAGSFSIDSPSNGNAANGKAGSGNTNSGHAVSGNADSAKAGSSSKGSCGSRLKGCQWCGIANDPQAVMNRHPWTMANRPPRVMVVALAAVRLHSVRDTVAETLGTPDMALALAAAMLLSAQDTPAVVWCCVFQQCNYYTWRWSPHLSPFSVAGGSLLLGSSPRISGSPNAAARYNKAPGDEKQASPGRVVQASPGDGKQASPGDDEQASPVNGDQAFPGDGKQASPGDGEQASLGVTGSAALGVAGSAALGDAGFPSLPISLPFGGLSLCSPPPASPTSPPRTLDPNPNPNS